MNRWLRHLPWAVLAAGLILRLAAWDAFRDSALYAVAEDSGHDRTLYHTAAREVAEGNLWPDESFAYLPLYPWVLGVAYAVFGASPAVAGGLGIALDLGALALLMVLARRLGAGAAATAAAGAVYAFYPLAILYGFATMPNTLNGLLVAALALCFQAARPFTWRAGLGIGLFAGMTSLGFAGAILMTVAGFAVVLFQERKTALPGVAAGLAAMAAVMAPVALHNARVEGQWTGLTTHSGFNLYMGNHERATGYPLRVLDFRMTAQELLEDAHAHAEKKTGHALTRAGSSAWWKDQAKAFWAEHPGRALALTGKKALLFWNHRDVDDLRLVEQFRLLTGWRLRGDFLLIGALGLAGLMLCRRGPRVTAMTLAGIAGLTGFFITARYRLAFAPLLLALGAAGVDVAVRDRAWRRVGVALSISLVVALLPFRIPDQSAVDAYNASLQLLQDDDLENAERLLTEALREHPGHPNLNHALGSLRFRQGRFEEAAEAFRICADQEPRHPNARFNQGLSLARAGRLCEGLAALREIPEPGEQTRRLMTELAPHCR